MKICIKCHSKPVIGWPYEFTCEDCSKALCPRCFGSGTTDTGIAEMGHVLCDRCDGTGERKQEQPHAAA